MERRARLLLLATVPLYLGPLLAGFSGMGWSAIPVFVALMALWLVVLRPHQWPRRMTLWTSAVAVSAAAQVATNAVIVVILFGIGRALGAVAGFDLLPDPLVSVGLSFVSIPLSRLVWDPASARDADLFLDSANVQINAVSHGAGPGGSGVQDSMIRELLALPDAADPALTAAAIAAALQAPGAAARLSQLQDALEHGTDLRSGLREGLILWASDPVRAADPLVHGVQRTAFLAAGDNARLLALFARRSLPLLQADPELWSSYPDPTRIRSALNDSLPEAVQHQLLALAAAVEAATPAQDRATKA